MSSYICEKYGYIENTALGSFWSNLAKKESLQCSECNTGKWHDMFEKSIGQTMELINYLN